MTISVKLEIKVDPQTWENVYGASDRALVDDVEDYIFALIQGSAAATEGALEPTGYAVQEI